jgi:two-component system CheB/CheR fusion protein
VLTTEKGEILYLRGKTSTVLEPAAGGADWNIFAMVRGGLRSELRSAFRKALADGTSIHRAGIRLEADGVVHVMDVTVEPLREPSGLRGTVMTVFAEAVAPRPTKASSRSQPVARDQEALTQARQDLRTALEELQSSREEMRTSQEELQSTNEELQSTNEELTTSKEEMQSMNEELQTLNHELQIKVDDLSRANNDMKNLLDSTDIATLFLDASLQVRRFTAQTAKLFKLIPGDVGRPITDLAWSQSYPDLADDAQGVLRTLFPKEKAIATEDGRWLGVRVLPYRTLENKIDGVVITFMDITVAKNLEASLRHAQSGLEARIGKQAAELERAGLHADEAE